MQDCRCISALPNVKICRYVQLAKPDIPPDCIALLDTVCNLVPCPPAEQRKKRTKAQSEWIPVTTRGTHTDIYIYMYIYIYTHRLHTHVDMYMYIYIYMFVVTSGAERTAEPFLLRPDKSEDTKRSKVVKVGVTTKLHPSAPKR